MDKQFFSQETVTRVRETYPPGCRVELISMDDPYRKLQIGVLGTVDFVDDTGTVFIIWDCGPRLGAVYDEDVIKRI